MGLRHGGGSRLFGVVESQLYSQEKANIGLEDIWELGYAKFRAANEEGITPCIRC